MKKQLLLLFVIQLIWASSYTVMKIALGEMPFGLILILRYGIASLLFLMAGQLRLRENFSPREWFLILLVGVINFSGSPYFQLRALELCSAVDASILVAFEPLLTALIALILLKERIGWSTTLTFFIATVGVLVMNGSLGGDTPIGTLRLWGNLFFILSLTCEGIYSAASRSLTERHPPLRLIAWMITAGFLASLLAHGSQLTMPRLTAIGTHGWLAIVYLALFPSTLCYSVWTFLLKKIPLNRLALSLFLQPIQG
ncbi:MAG: DMT family transporter, partial [Deltaproteobacteria bacterium]|nr:DMT family transporter [Deltaproteobacteria bacterium]